MNVDLSQFPELAPFFEGAEVIKSLGGLTNKNTLIQSNLGRMVLRVPGEGTEKFIRRDWEKVAATLASAIGVNVPVLYFDSKTGTQLTQFMDSAITMDSDRFKDLGAVARGAQCLRTVHESGTMFSNQFELFQQMEKYIRVLEGAVLPNGFAEVKEGARCVKEALSQHLLPLVPCHCDPLAENFLDTGSRMYLIDWEYAGNNDPMWDLGDLSVEAGFDETQDQVLFDAYFSTGQGRPFDRGRMVLYKAMCDLLWTLWGVLQHENKNPAANFWEYATMRFNRCRKLMNQDDFRVFLGDVLAGP